MADLIQAYMILPQERASRALDPGWAKLSEGRWNSQGIPVVYAASSLALAALERLVHCGVDDAAREHAAVTLELPRELLETLPSETLPERWATVPPRQTTQALGDAWAREGRSVVLAVPSAVVPSEHNYLMNVEHPQAGRVRVTEVRPFAFDPRLLRGQQAEAG